MSSTSFDGSVANSCCGWQFDERQHIALLIDWENLKIGLNNAYQVGPDPKALLSVAQGIGRVVEQRAYADWTRAYLCSDAARLYRWGVEPVYAPGGSPTGGIFKNSADFRLTIDATALALQRPEIGTYILVTGDRDLIHVVNFLRGRAQGSW